MWLVVCFIFSGLCFYQISDRIQFYLYDSSLTNSYYITLTKLAFPIITICPSVSFQSKDSITSFLKERNFHANWSEEMDELLKSGNISVFDLWKVTKLPLSKIKITFPYDATFDEKIFKVTEVYTLLGLCYSIVTNLARSSMMLQAKLQHLDKWLQDHAKSGCDFDLHPSFLKDLAQDVYMGSSIYNCPFLRVISDDRLIFECLRHKLQYLARSSS